MGIFEKSIPRYVYNPVQRQVEPVQDYYVDDIFDPLFNRNVRNALTQKYGNPLLGTAMGYYEGIENALFGQDDKWGILGPGMGILSGFGRSMDKAGDVILGSLTETVKGVTGQGFENPLENIFVEDEDYTGKRALASIANSMRGLAGGTTITEEDLDSAWNLPSLGVELATDPSILGGNLTKLAKTPSVAKQLGSADNMLGDVGKFLQQYDDVMAKASIDLTAPGLRPAIKALRNKFPKYIPGTSGTNYEDVSKEIFDIDLEDDAQVANAIAKQAEIANDTTLASLAKIDSDLQTVDTAAENAQKALEDLAATNSKKRTEMAEDFQQATAGITHSPNLSDDDILSTEAAHDAMKLSRKKRRKLLEEYSKLTSWDIANASKHAKNIRNTKRHALAKLESAIIDRNEDFGKVSEEFFDYVKKRGGKLDASPNIFTNDVTYDVYTNLVKTYLNLPKDVDINLDKYAKTLDDRDFIEYTQTMLEPVLDPIVSELNPEYAHRIDLSPYAWQTSEFTDNEATNKAIVRALGDTFKKFTTPKSGIVMSPSQMGKLSEDILNAGNDYADIAIADAVLKNVERNTFPKFTTEAEFRNAFKSKKVASAFKTIVPDETARKDIVEKLSRIMFPPEHVVDGFGREVPYSQYHRYKDFEELHSLFRSKAKLNRIDDTLYGHDFVTDSEFSTDLLKRTVDAPWMTFTPEMFLSNVSSAKHLFEDDAFAQSYATMFEYFTLGKGRTVNASTIKKHFGITLDDATVKLLKSDVAEYRTALDTVRHSVLSNSMSSETLFFKDLEKSLSEIDLKYLQPANLDLSMSRYDMAENPLSLNATVRNADGDKVEFGDLIADDGSVSGNAPKESYKISSPYYSPYAFDRDTLWVIRQTVDKNPQIFKNFKNVEEVSQILSKYFQTKAVDDVFDYSKYVDEIGKGPRDLEDIWFNAFEDNSVPTLLTRFEKEVLPLAKEATAKGYAPIPTKATAQYFPELNRILQEDTPLARAYQTMLRNLTDDWGYTEYVGKDGKTYSKFSGMLHPERFTVDSKRVELANLLLRQPKFEFEDARMQSVFSNAHLFDNRGGKLAHVKRFGDTGNSKYFVKKTYPKSQKFHNNAVEKAAFITEVRPATAAELAYNPPTPASLAIKHAQESWSPNYSDEMQARMQAAYRKIQEANPKNIPPSPSKTPKTSSPEPEKGPRVWRWFDKIREAVAVRANNLGLTKDSAGNIVERATLRTKRNADLIQHGKDMGMPQSTVRDVMKLLTERDGDVLTGAEFFDEIRRTGVIQASFTDRNVANAAYLRLKHNVDVFNAAVKKSPKDADALTIVSRKMSNGNLELKVMFNTKNKKIAKQISKNVKGLRAANFADVTFLNARQLTTDELAFLASDDAKKVVDYLTEVNEMARDQARMLGFTFDEMAVHNKHVRNVDPITANYIANDIYSGIDLDSIDEIGVVLSNLDEFRQLDRGVFGAQLQGRRFRGAYWNYDTKDASLFTNDLEKIAKGSLGDGMFANSNYQSFVDFFVNDNFKIHGVFEDVDDIRKFLYAGGSEGLYAGNLKNIDLCVPKYDSNGRIIGIHRFDQYSDADLAKALANPDTILVPANTIDTLDKVIRKEIRLSNKAYAFLNKHFTIPFKFGVLTNPGFLVGNLNDAYLKQAVSMSEKYGTDVSAELAKVGEASAMYLNLGNSFNAAIDKWKKHMDEVGVELSGAETIPEILAGHGPSRKRLMEYLEGNLKDSKGNVITPILDDSEKGTIMLWTKLQQIQHTSNSLREFDDFAEAFGTSDYDVPRNIVDRILQGSGKYNGRKPSTWGVITNNPVSRAAMNASEFIENTMRGTAILNDLLHAGYSREQIIKILMSDDSVAEFAAAKRLFEVDYANAVNAMYEANFNYERMSDFMEGVGKAMPFPTFFLKNLTYWLELFSKNPQFFDHAITVQESMWQDRDVSNAEIEAEAKGRGAVPIEVPGGIDKASGQKLSKWFKGIFKPSPLQSMFGAFSLINDPVEDLSYRLHPAISGSAQAVNQALPHSPLTTFLGEAKYRPYSTDIYEKNVTQEDENFNSLEYALHKANPYERAVNTALRTPNKISEGQAQLSDFLPSIFQPDFGKK